MTRAAIIVAVLERIEDTLDRIDDTLANRGLVPE